MIRSDGNAAQTYPVNVRDLPNFVDGQWNPTRSNNYAKDCQRGREAGAVIRTAIKQSNNPALLPAVAGAIVSAGEFGAIEIGVFSELGIALS